MNGYRNMDDPDHLELDSLKRSLALYENHECDYKPTKRVLSDGRICLWVQCPICFHAKAAKQAGYVLSELPDFDETSPRIYTIKDRIYEIEYKLKQSAFWSQYNEYLGSMKWGEKRKRVMSRAGGICEGCGVRQASQVHHLSYENVGNEFLWELVAICSECHDRVHEEKKQ